MNTIDTRYAMSPEETTHASTTALRDHFLVCGLFSPDRLTATAFDYDRMIVLGAKPITKTLEFGADLAALAGLDHFLERRELGVINLGGRGKILCDSAAYELNPFDGLYVGRGTRTVRFESADPSRPARFYMCCVPAHAPFPIRKINVDELGTMAKGENGSANDRRTALYIHPDILPTSQLAMGLTRVSEGSVWNSVPPHQHSQRMEVYLYFDLNDSLVFHIMGVASDTRHIVVRNEQAVISPSWSLHFGAGLSRFSYIWSTAGENLLADQRNLVPLSQIF